MSQFDTCFFERYAKISLETLLDEGFSSLVNKDRPDLQSPDGVSLGIEVTRAMPESKETARSMLKEIIDIGETVKISYVDQQHRSIDPDKTVFETIAGNSEWVRLGNKDINARAWVSRFNFSGSDQEKLCGVLSGGERNRLHLALTLKDEGNVLLLDEPTNDVDVNTIRALEDGLENFAGCAVVISHDRWFLDRIATHILAYEGDSNVVFFEGNYAEYEENRKARLGNTEPKRFKYKKLME